MNDFKLGPGLSTTWIVVTMAMVLFGSRPLQAQTPGAAAPHIQTYYQELMPTIRKAGRLNVCERDRRFGPDITAPFDPPTMTRLEVGPAWEDFSQVMQDSAQDALPTF